MKVTLVPSSIASAGEEPSQCLINDTLAVVAGSLGVSGTAQT